MSTYSYPSRAILGDYGRASFGFAATALPLALLQPATPVAWILGSLAALFGWFGCRTALRQLRSLEITPETIALRGPLGRQIAWHDLDRLRLRYYAPRRNKNAGWMQLTLQGGGRKIQVDSTIDGFETIAGRAAAEAGTRGLSVDDITVENLSAMGIPAPAED